MKVTIYSYEKHFNIVVCEIGQQNSDKKVTGKICVKSFVKFTHIQFYHY